MYVHVCNQKLVILVADCCKGGNMQTESLRYFVELARTGSFYGAAKNVFISQQGLNKAIGALEAELGVKLVERSSRGVRLTSAGEVFLKHAKLMLDDYSLLIRELYAEHRAVTPADTRLVLHMTYYPVQISRPFIEGTGALDSVNIVEDPFVQVVEGAEASDGSELFLLDAYHETLAWLATRPDLIFEPVLASQLGVVWKDGSPLAGYQAIHREQLADLPLAVDSHREMARLVEGVMEGRPLNNVRLAVANPRATLEFAASSCEVAATYDSFGFALAQASPTLDTGGLHFTPFSTPRSQCLVGFLYARSSRPGIRGRHAIDMLKRYLRDTCRDYMEQHPLP